MEESLEDFLKKDMNDQIEDLFFSNYMKEGQAIPPIKVKSESPFIDNNMKKILNQMKYEEKYKRYENLNKKNLYWKVMMIGGDKSGKFAQSSTYNYLHNYDASSINEENYEHFDISYKGKRFEVKFSAVFSFTSIKPEYFDYILFIGLDKNINFYFNLMSKEEVINYIAKHNLIRSETGYTISASKSNSFFQKFGNHLSIEDIDNYIKEHSNS